MDLQTPGLSGRGLVLGKFFPPTNGHKYLIDFATSYAGEVTVVVGTLENDSIPGALRYEWVKEMCPRAKVVHLTEELPQYPHEHPRFWDLWRTALTDILPYPVDYVFASEDYGFRLAEEMNARYIPVDHARELVPVSGSAVREDPLKNWPHIPAVVRPYFVKKVCLVGPESTGKTTLASALADHYNTVYAHEYARPLIDAYGAEMNEETFARIVRGQAASEAAMARQANRLLFCDSDAFTTLLYHELYLGGRPAYIEEEARRRIYDQYLLHRPDTPFAEDPQRHHKDQRDWFFQEVEAWLKARGANYAIIEGDWEHRFRLARRAVDTLLAAVS